MHLASRIYTGFANDQFSLNSNENLCYRRMRSHICEYQVPYTYYTTMSPVKFDQYFEYACVISTFLYVDIYLQRKFLFICSIAIHNQD